MNLWDACPVSESLSLRFHQCPSQRVNRDAVEVLSSAVWAAGLLPEGSDE